MVYPNQEGTGGYDVAIMNVLCAIHIMCYGLTNITSFHCQRNHKRFSSSLVEPNGEIRSTAGYFIVFRGTKKLTAAGFDPATSRYQIIMSLAFFL